MRLLLAVLIVVLLTISHLLLYNQVEMAYRPTHKVSDAISDSEARRRPLETTIQQRIRDFARQATIPSQSCVRNCENGGVIKVQLPTETWAQHCDHQQQQQKQQQNPKQTEGFVLCTLSQFAISNPAYERLILANHTTMGTCDKPGFVACPLPFPSDCVDHCWNEWTASVSLDGLVSRAHIYNLRLLPQRPFRILALYPPSEQDIDTRIQPVTNSDVFGLLDLDPNAAMSANIDNHLRVISYYLPNAMRRDRCNTVYCVYEYPNSDLEIQPAQPGDISLAFCPLPKDWNGYSRQGRPRLSQEQVLLRMTYDFETLSEPYPLQFQQVVPLLGPVDGQDVASNMDAGLSFVYMSICAMVRKEGPNLLEWLEFHRMMGYERFILYDNNDPSDPDILMDEILSKYSAGVIVRLKWAYNHSQTEALTDCIQRFRHTTEWMTFIDVDEFMAPARKFRTVRHALENMLDEKTYIHSDWMTFGPCGETARKVGQLVIDLCRNVTKPTSYSPKPTFRIKHAMSIQGYGPHYIRLWADRAVRTRSKSDYVSGHLLIYHYRYRSWEEFVARRKGPTAGRVMVWDDDRFTAEWKKALQHNKPISKSAHRIARFIPALKKRLQSTKGVRN